MDDLMIIVGALILAVGVALVYVPAGVITFGVLLITGGYAQARARKPTAS